MKNITAFIFVLLAMKAQAQNIGVNNLTPDASAILDITHTSRGLLIPRLPLTSTTDVVTITSPALSLLVFNTATAGVSPNDVTPGYYYWNGIKWVGLITPPTTNTINSAGNIITSTIGGVVDTTLAVNSVSNTSIANSFTTTINSVVGASVPIVNSVSNTLTGNNLTTTVNGVTGAVVNLSTIVPATTNTMSSTGNTITNTTNGVAATAPTINSVSNTLTGNNLTTTVNGVTGAVVNLSTIVPATTNTMSSTGNTITNTTNGIAATAPAINSVSNTSTTNNLTTTVNGVLGTAVTMVNSLNNNYNTTTGLFNTTVNGVAGVNITLPTNNAMGDSVRTLAWLTKGNAGTTAGNNFVGTIDNQDLVFKTNSIENMRILNTNGNVGIGTITPALKLHLHDGAQNFHAIRLTSGISQANYWDIVKRGDAYGAGQNHNFVFAYNNVERVSISPAGNVGINNSTPTQKLDIAGSVKITDGTEGLGKVLTSDATGKGTWKDATANTYDLNSAIVGPILNVTSANGNTITLEKGVYYVQPYNLLVGITYSAVYYASINVIALTGTISTGFINRDFSSFAPSTEYYTMPGFIVKVTSPTADVAIRLYSPTGVVFSLPTSSEALGSYFTKIN
ncbi:MAG: hypothetical protein H7331_08130 [Bacteroidia bacterium]|nr:hypothetical protein [Bacteroidia bacterium]